MTEENRATILIVDDDPNIRMFVRKILEKNTFHVYESEGCEDAKKKFKAVIPDLILLDINMHGASGFDFLEWLKENDDDPRCPVIMISTDAVAENVMKAKDLGAVDFMRKPLDPQLVLKKIQKILEKNQKN